MNTTACGGKRPRRWQRRITLCLLSPATASAQPWDPEAHPRAWPGMPATRPNLPL